MMDVKVDQVSMGISTKVAQGYNSKEGVKQATTKVYGQNSLDGENKSNNVDESANSTNETLRGLAEKLNEQIGPLRTNIRFEFNEEASMMTISVIEKDSGEVIRQIPSEEALKLTEYFKGMVGLIYDKEN